MKDRCFGNKPGQTIYAAYHDTEWGRPVYDDQVLFEFLILEWAQAGLNWGTILKRRDAYRQAFHDFDPTHVAAMPDAALQDLHKNGSIIKNRLKIWSARKNARVFLEIQAEFGASSAYLWAFVNNTPIVNQFEALDEVPAETDISSALSKDLKKRGASFVGPIIMYAYMQAVGMVGDHLSTC